MRLKYENEGEATLEFVVVFGSALAVPLYAAGIHCNLHIVLLS